MDFLEIRTEADGTVWARTEIAGVSGAVARRTNVLQALLSFAPPTTRHPADWPERGGDVTQRDSRIRLAAWEKLRGPGSPPPANLGRRSA